ncbi:hypothetical protein H072_3208 [Dactylellina haptotyla CBS 200.50]|uniref:STAS domain-containing protein n=1 Tax=Dactylellina haptotyla (strain CBS 200.50) TaxID=1284197 RepID=S8AIW0_DACHA|nr:hypothetical protein H072_3208 [Dactylellina haptotyla CBS 200.50]
MVFVYLESPDQHNWAAYGAERIRNQTAELASLAISAASSFKTGGEYSHVDISSPSISTFPLVDRAISVDNPLPVTSRPPLQAARESEEAIIEESDSQSSEGYGKSPGPSHLTRLLRNSPPEEPIIATTRHPRITVVQDDNSSFGDPGTTERDGLLSRGQGNYQPSYDSISPGDAEAQTNNRTGRKFGSAEEINARNAYICSLAMRIASPKSWDKRAIWRNAVVAPVSTLPAVILGLLLNVLDGLSYGMILFPLGESIFSDLAPDGLSMFYVSCIVSQLVYSCGFSKFKGGVGSEMIEVVPFFHKMAFTILSEVGSGHPEVVLSTTIVSMALSSIMTGLVFFLLGYLKSGSLIGFFPRHILVGCIGGVGWFLIATALEVAARLDGSLEYNLNTLEQLVSFPTLLMWMVPLGLAIVLLVILQFVNHPFTVPIFFISVPAIFYVIVAAVPSLTIVGLRDRGWIFDAPKSGVPFWHFYTLYDLRVVDWEVVLMNVPAMLALTFFGILHVPINVPSLGVSLNMDNVDVDQELIAHGVSNALSGCVGSIQNYLVYANSVLFIRSGGNSRLAGIMLAFGTAAIWMVGPSIIGYIPVLVVAALIFMLGIELLREAVYDTWGKLHKFEYLTVCVIVVTMGAYDFVIGIVVGILLACVTFVIQASQKSSIRATYTGATARSTVRRHPFQQRFLKEVGPQLYLYKLAGYIFFGTISTVENSILDLLHERNFSKRPIRFLILDMTHVRGIDFSAAETFVRIRKALKKRNIILVLSGIVPNGDVDIGLQGVGIWSDDGNVRLFPDLNDALEWCENEFLEAYYASKDHAILDPAHLEVPNHQRPSIGGVDMVHNSPRINQLRAAAKTTLKETEVSSSKWSNFKQPLPLLLQTFQERTMENEDFWFNAVDFFERRSILKGAVLFHCGDSATEFYLIQDGLLRAEYDHQTGSYYESITAGTTCGELPFFAETPRTATVVAERDCVTWVMNREQWVRLQELQPQIASELYRLALKLTTERMDSIMKQVEELTQCLILKMQNHLQGSDWY